MANRTILQIGYKGGTIAKVTRALKAGQAAETVWADVFTWVKTNELYRGPLLLKTLTGQILLLEKDIQFINCEEA